MGKKKGFFSKHSKSSAMVVTVGLHAVFAVVAITIVAVHAIKKEPAEFVAEPVARIQPKLKKLQVPVDASKAPKAPKLRQNIVAPKVKNVAISLPTTIGVVGGISTTGSGFGGGAGGVGFEMPEVKIFGVESKAERIMLILNGRHEMSSDSLGGAYGYEVIKGECLKLIEGLPSTVVFNMIVFDGDSGQMLFPDMRPAIPDNVQQAKSWLDPLNKVVGTKTKYGIRTLGKGGQRYTDGNEFQFGKYTQDFFHPREWNTPVFYAMKQRADATFLMTCSWGSYMYFKEDKDTYWKKWFETLEGKLYKERAAEGHKKLAEENAARKAAGEPPVATSGSDRAVVRMFFPGTKEPPNPPHWDLGVKDFVEAYEEAHESYSKQEPRTQMAKKRKESAFSLNVIFFRPEEDSDRVLSYEENFKMLAGSLDGECRSVEGLAAIKNFVK